MLYVFSTPAITSAPETIAVWPWFAAIVAIVVAHVLFIGASGIGGGASIGFASIGLASTAGSGEPSLLLHAITNAPAPRPASERRNCWRVIIATSYRARHA